MDTLFKICYEYNRFLFYGFDNAINVNFGSKMKYKSDPNNYEI